VPEEAIEGLGATCKFMIEAADEAGFFKFVLAHDLIVVRHRSIEQVMCFSTCVEDDNTILHEIHVLRCVLRVVHDRRDRFWRGLLSIFVEVLRKAHRGIPQTCERGLAALGLDMLGKEFLCRASEMQGREIGATFVVQPKRTVQEFARDDQFRCGNCHGVGFVAPNVPAKQTATAHSLTARRAIVARRCGLA
jgi:hypothetical protein